MCWIIENQVSACVTGRNDFLVNFKDSYRNVAFVQYHAAFWVKNSIDRAMHHESRDIIFKLSRMLLRPRWKNTYTTFIPSANGKGTPCLVV